MSTMVLKAIEFATAKHEGQVRKVTGEPYITHPIMVSYILAQYKQSKNIEELICASLLHDTLEDTDTSFSEIVTEFSPLVASLVLELTNDDSIIKEVGKLQYMKTKLIGISSYALTIKLADRLANMSDKPTQKSINETVEIIKHISKERKLSTTQTALCKDIMGVCLKAKEGN